MNQMLLNRRVVLIAIAASAIIGVLADMVTLSGRDIPRVPPDSSRTVRHSLGFSIVAPPNWNCDTRIDTVGILTPGLYLSPKTFGSSRRYSAGLTVALSDDRERERDANKLKPRRFQGQPAVEMSTTGEVGDGVPAFTYTMHFERHGRWFVIRYRVFDGVNQLPSRIQEYLDTFTYDYNAANNRVAAATAERSPTP